MNNKHTSSELMTRAEAASYLKICMSTLDKIINSKDFCGKIKIGRRVLINKDVLEKYISEQYV